MEIIVKTLEQLFSEPINDRANTHNLYLPIHKIYNIGVKVCLFTLLQENTKTIYLTIDSDKIFEDDDGNTHYRLYGKMVFDSRNNTNINMLTHELTDSISKTIEIIKNLKLNKYTGKLYYDEVQYNELDSAFMDLLGNIEYVEYTCNECCVCTEKTRNKTCCGHSICIECISNLSYDDEEDEISCPMCRANIILNYQC